MPSTPVIAWYRNDLRIADHAPLAAAARHDAPVIAVFVLDENPANRWPAGGASRWWLHHSLASLADALERIGGRLVIRRGDTVAVLREIANSHRAGALYFERRYEPFERELEERVHDALADRLEVRRFGGRLLNEPERISNASGEPYRVFTPFSKACLRLPEPAAPGPAPRRLAPPTVDIKSLDLADLGLLPARPDWAGGLRETWSPGAAGAHEALETFLDEALCDYHQRRDQPGLRGTSRLSGHLAFGEISPRQVWHAVRERQAADSAATRGGDALLREILWREFCHHLLFHWPTFPERPFNDAFAHFPWRDDEEAFARWTRGETGYPLVDAGMRELWRTGWMHNRVRMAAASFLVKHLLVDWRRGQRWFWDTLVDADLANNACNWQWVAGCGADAAPYFRIFNPVLQGRKFDPNGDYTRRWVPELAALPDRHLHAPFDAPADVLAAAGVSPGRDYPHPVVEHGFARRRALDALSRTKSDRRS